MVALDRIYGIYKTIDFICKHRRLSVHEPSPVVPAPLITHPLANTDRTPKGTFIDHGPVWLMNQPPFSDLQTKNLSGNPITWPYNIPRKILPNYPAEVHWKLSREIYLMTWVDTHSPAPENFIKISQIYDFIRTHPMKPLPHNQPTSHFIAPPSLLPFDPPHHTRQPWRSDRSHCICHQF